MRKKKMAALCSLVLCILFTACGRDAGEIFLFPEDGESVGAGSGEAVVGATAEQFGGEASSAICVYVCGAVKCPGVVELPEGSRVNDALEAAGGFAEDASRDHVNLAARVADGEKLFFPTCEEAASAAEEKSGDGLININTASSEELCTLPGIGASRAADIIRYREREGTFETCEDIMKVTGIKNSVYDKIKDRIKVN